MSSFNSSKTVLIENGTKPISEPKTYGSINSGTNESNVTDIEDNKGWLTKATNGVYGVGAGAVCYGMDGLKWVLTSTASIGSSVVSVGTEGVVKLKKSVSKDKNE